MAAPPAPTGRAQVSEAEEYAEADRQQLGRVEGRNGLENYLYRLRSSTLDSADLGPKLSADDREALSKAVGEAQAWLEGQANASTEKEEYEAKQKEVEQVASPIMKRLYEAGGGGAEAEQAPSADGSEAEQPSVEEVDE